MDSVTQIALGGAVGYAVLGKQVGPKALVWGAVLGTLPDLDVLIPYGDPISDFTYHRGFSHSLLVHVLSSPMIAWLIYTFHSRGERFTSEHDDTSSTKSQFKRWVLLVFLCLSSHALLDACTVYGTQLLWPLTEYPFGLSNLFIIDPLVTLPLLGGLLFALLPPVTRQRAYRMNNIGLVLCCAYIAWTLAAKVYIDAKVKKVLVNNNIQPTAYVSTPSPLNTLLWRVVAVSDDEYFEIYASVFDEISQVSIDSYPTQPELLMPIQSDWGVQRLQWFTKGLYAVKEDNNQIVISDLRMGVECAYVFNFVVAEKTLVGTIRSDYEQLTQRPDLGELNNIFKRVWDPTISLAPSAQKRKGC